jgi:FkbM family methyltransferase
VRRNGYEGRIVSFEPLADAYGRLEERSRSDPRWDCVRLALGDTDGSAEIHVAGNSMSSSLLDMEPLHLRAAPKSAYVGTESVPIARLDSIWADIAGDADRVYLKMDVQGYELNVLGGAALCLSTVACVEAELSLAPLYRDQADFREVIAHLEKQGFRLFALEPCFEHPQSGQMLSMDGIFSRPLSAP